MTWPEVLPRIPISLLTPTASTTLLYCHTCLDAHLNVNYCPHCRTLLQTTPPQRRNRLRGRRR